jgi:hypothetical protein
MRGFLYIQKVELAFSNEKTGKTPVFIKAGQRNPAKVDMSLT